MKAKPQPIRQVKIMMLEQEIPSINEMARILDVATSSLYNFMDGRSDSNRVKAKLTNFFKRQFLA